MALLSQAVKDKELDIRMIERNLSKGLVSHEEVAKKKAALLDESENAAYTNIEELAQGIAGKSSLRTS